MSRCAVSVKREECVEGDGDLEKWGCGYYYFFVVVLVLVIKIAELKR